MSYVMCHMACVRCHMSHTMYYFFHFSQDKVVESSMSDKDLARLGLGKGNGQASSKLLGFGMGMKDPIPKSSEKSIS